MREDEVAICGYCGVDGLSSVRVPKDLRPNYQSRDLPRSLGRNRHWRVNACCLFRP
jgi:hypothetical protein